MAKDASQRSSGGSSWLPMAVAVLAIAGFIAWLATRQPPETIAVAEPGDTTEQADSDTTPATVVPPEQLVQPATAQGLVGQRVEVSSVRVQDVLGAQMFWIEMPDGSPFLVQMGSTLLARGTAQPTAGSRVRVIGRVAEKTPEVVDAWIADGVITEEQRILAEYGSTYIEAQRVEPAAPAEEPAQ